MQRFRVVSMKVELRVIFAFVLLALIIGYLVHLGLAAGVLDIHVRPLPIWVSAVGLLPLVVMLIVVWRSRRRGGPGRSVTSSAARVRPNSDVKLSTETEDDGS